MPVFWYGVILSCAFLVGAVYALRRVRAFGLDSDRVSDVILIAIVGAIVGARLYYVAFTWKQYSSLLEIFSTRSGGLAIYAASSAPCWPRPWPAKLEK
jgi:phosphatidylglycerol:prolipoprotein diacylglycerol transferase